MGLAPGVVRQQLVETVLGLLISVPLTAAARRRFGHPVGRSRRGLGGFRGRDRLSLGCGADGGRRGGPDGGRGRDHRARADAGDSGLVSCSGRAAIGRQRLAEGLQTLRQRLGFDQAVPGAQRRDERPVDGHRVALGLSRGERTVEDLLVPGP